MVIDDAISVLPKHIRILCGQGIDRTRIKELRLRAGSPFIIATLDREYIFDYVITEEDIKETMAYVSGYSIYAYENELRQGYITIPGGNRIGICGKIVCENGKVATIKNISSINLRVAHEIKGVSDNIMEWLYKPSGEVYSTLIISSPGRGKTTILRDIIRNISSGFAGREGINVGVVDERSEIGAMRLGVLQNDLGIRCDVLDGCPKTEGMYMLLRSMNPAVIAVDELGMESDICAVLYAMNCGCQIIATIHGDSLNTLQNKKSLSCLFEAQCFERFIVLSDRGMPGTVEGIYDKAGHRL